MKITKLSLFVAVAASLLLTSSVFAALPYLPVPLYSGFFNFATGELGSVGAAENWANNNVAITITNGSGSLDGTGLGLVASTGDKAYVLPDPTISEGTYCLFSAKGTFPQTTNVDLYYSFLLKFDSVPPVGGEARIIQNNLQNSSSTTYWGIDVTNDAGTIELGIEKTPGSGNPIVYATTNIVVGQTYFVVVRHQILPGTTDDIMDLWVNPAPASFGVSDTDVPPTSATTSSGTEPSSASGPGRFFLDSGPNYSYEFDELRIATNWDVVTPAFGSCISAGVYSNPVSKTNVAEIADTFNVIPSPLCTSPAYQWQLAPAASSSWANITGAINSSYTTPNLVLATDNGNQYRCIITVPCDGSSATSTVATVTLTAPVVTPVGTVLDDTFNAGIAEPILPVTSTNAAWYTDLADYSSSFDIVSGPPSYLLATPISGKSSLWLAYITPTNDLPVDLAVGNTMVATLQFSPNSFNSFTNNQQQLRFGLYDYADGGTRITNADSTCGGSTGNGVNVMGYMLGLSFGPTFSGASPITLYSRVGLSDIDLMGSEGDYTSLGAGPGGDYTNAPAFQAGDTYTLVFSVTRSAVNTVVITNSISGGGTNWMYSLTETNQAYHRFDAFSIRPDSLETSADSFNLYELAIQVVAGPSVPTGINISGVFHAGNNVILSWIPTPSGTYSYTVQQKNNLTDATWNTLQSGISGTSYTNTAATGDSGFYRVTSP